MWHFFFIHTKYFFNTYQIHTNTNNEYKYIQYIHILIQASTCQYILIQTNTDKCLQLLTIHTIMNTYIFKTTIHTKHTNAYYTCKISQLMQIHTNTA